jgi:hypothetical protein
MNRAPERATDVGVVLDILHSKTATCEAGSFLPERWKHAAYQGGTACPFSATRGTS